MKRKEIIEKLEVAIQKWSDEGYFPYDRNGQYRKNFSIDFELDDDIVATLEMSVETYSCYDRGDYDTPPSWEGYYRWNVDYLEVYKDGELIFEEANVEELGGEV